jgi:hypothetical protein
MNLIYKFAFASFIVVFMNMISTKCGVNILDTAYIFTTLELTQIFDKY